MNKKYFKINKGIRNGLFSAITWGADTALVGIVITSISNISFYKAIFLAPFITAFLHDLFSVMWVTIYLFLRRELKNSISKLKLKNTKEIILGGLLGGPVGMTCYLLSINYIGPSYTACITSLYPAFGALLAKVILKEKLNKKAWIGILLSLIGIVFLSDFITFKDINILGYIFAAICLVAWGSEAVLCSLGTRGEELDTDTALFVRQLTSAIVYGFLIIPIIGGLDLTIASLLKPEVLIIIFISLLGTSSYLFYYSSIKKIGPSKAMGINITYFLWAVIIDTVILNSNISLNVIISGCMILIGSYLIAKD